jgi:hypothetical protein
VVALGREHGLVEREERPTDPIVVDSQGTSPF